MVTTEAPVARASVGDSTERRGLTTWALLVVIAVAWGRTAIAHRPGAAVRAAPLVGRWVPRLTPAIVPAAVLAVVAVIAAPRLAALRWRTAVAVAAAASAAWAFALAASDGLSRVAAPLGTQYEIEPFAAHVGSPFVLLRTFVERLPAAPTHVAGHPPGAVLVFWLAARAGLGGPGGAAVVVFAAVALTTAATAVAARAVLSEHRARSALPFIALAPAAVWAGTSPDPVYAAVAAAGVTCVAVAAAADRERPLLAVVGGTLLATAVYLSYGLVLLLALPTAVVFAHRAWPTATRALAGAGAVVVAFTIAGFWWPAGLAATHRAYGSGAAHHRPYWYFATVGDPAAVALATGPAVAAALGTLRRARVALLVVPALAAIAVADVSGLAKAEVERIWLPFVPWLLIATVPLAGKRPGSLRRWLGLQLAVGIALQVALRSPW